VRKRLAFGISIPVVLLFIGIIVALLIPSNMFVLTDSLDRLGLLGGRAPIAGLVPVNGDVRPLIIVNGTLWDAEGGKRPNPGLAIRGGRFAAVRDPGADSIDATGMTVLPGLIDMHVHSLGGRFAGEMMIGNGVTSARDLGTHLEGVLALRRESEAPSLGRFAGPRLFVTGPYLVSGMGASDQEIGVPDPSSAAAVVERFAGAGTDGIKVHWGISAETLLAVVETAHRRGLWVAAHLDQVSASQAARIGVDTIEHASGSDWDAGEAATRQAEEAMIARGVALTPTLVVAEHAFTLPGLARASNPLLAYFPSLLRRSWVASQTANASAEHLDSGEIEKRRERLELIKRFTLRFHRAGGQVLAGTDAPAYLVAPGFDVHRELELLVEAGLTPAEALDSATRQAAIALRRGREMGGLQPGMLADLILVWGDPLSKDGGISATRNIVLVIKGGRIVLDRRRVQLTPDRPSQ